MGLKVIEYFILISGFRVVSDLYVPQNPALHSDTCISRASYRLRVRLGWFVHGIGIRDHRGSVLPHRRWQARAKMLSPREVSVSNSLLI